MRELGHAHLAPIVLAASLAFASIYVSVLKWGMFLRYFGIEIKKAELYVIYSAAGFFSNFLPTTVGGDAYRFVSLSGRLSGMKKKEVASSMILERFMGLVAIFVANLACAPLFYKEMMNNRALLIMEGAVLLLFVVVCMMVYLSKYLVAFIRSYTRNAIAGEAANLLESLHGIKNRRVLAAALGCSLIFTFLVVLARSLVFGAFGLHPSFFFLVFSTTLIQIASQVPISLNSIGVAEGVSVFLYSTIGVSAEASVAVALVARVSMVVTSSIGGLLYLLSGGTLLSLRRDRRVELEDGN